MAKKIMSAFIAVMLVICASAIPAFAADGPSAYVSISDKDGKLVLVLEKIDLSDADGDGTITINDALYLAHEAEFEGGAAAGYASEQSDYGLSLTKLRILCKRCKCDVSRRPREGRRQDQRLCVHRSQNVVR